MDHGYQVTVLTGHTGRYQVENIEGIDVHWLPVSYDNTFGFLTRSFSFLNYVWQVLRRSSLYKNADVCYAISVPLTVGIAAMRIKRKYGIPFIFEVGDLWPDAPIEMGFIKNSIFKNRLYKLERRIYREASAVVGLSPAINRKIKQRTSAKKIYLIPNMSDTCFFQPVRKNDEVVRRFKVQHKFVVSYIGAVGLANGLDYFLACARESQQALLPVHFFLCGEGAALPGLKEKALLMELDNLTFIPFQNRDGVAEIMHITDAAFVCYAPVAILETGSPNKYFDGLAAGKLILVNFGGWIRAEIEEQQCGIYIDPSKPADFVTAITPFLKSKTVLEQYQQAARQLAESRYSRKQLGDRFVAMFKEVVDLR